MTTLEEIEWEQCILEPQPDRELARPARKELERVSKETQLFSSSPWLVRSFIQLQSTHLPVVYTDAELIDPVTLVVSRDSSCRYCEQLGTPQFVDFLGMAALANTVCQLAIVLDEP